MIYLDYAATTPVDEEVLHTFVEATKNYIGNPNSLHKLGQDANHLIEAATKQIASLLHVKEKELIYTSGSSESNNMVIKGIALKYQNRGKHIITTEFEHSSVYGPLNYLQQQGFTVSFVKSDEFGRIDMEDLKSKLTDDTILVTVDAVNSEIGVLQPIDEIGLLLQEYPKCFFHVDMTQALGKVPISLKYIDLATFASHKIYGIKGIGVLYKKENIALEPIIHGGKSTTVYRSGTPATGLIVSLAKAMRLVLEENDAKNAHVQVLHEKLIAGLEKYERVYINSNSYCIPHVINLSVLGVKPETMLHALEAYDIYISTQTACSTGAMSKSVYALTHDEKRATSSIRISISHLTTEEEISYFLECFEKCYQDLI